MTNENFMEQFNRLAEAFSVVRPKERSFAYFKEFESISQPLFALAVSKVIREHDRFPSISQLLGLIDSLMPKASTEPRQSCDVCDGYGSVFIHGIAFRGDCAHGEKLSNKIKVAPKDRQEIENQYRRMRAEDIEIYGETPNRTLPIGPNGKRPHWWYGETTP